VIGSRDDDRVNIFTIQQASKVAIRIALASVLARDLDATSQMLLVDIADGRRMKSKRLEVVAALSAHADVSEHHAVVRTEGLARDEIRNCDRGRRTARSLQERPARGSRGLLFGRSSHQGFVVVHEVFLFAVQG